MERARVAGGVMVNGTRRRAAVPDPPCPNEAEHTSNAPRNPVDAERLARTHDQVRCEGCDRYEIWVERPAGMLAPCFACGRKGVVDIAQLDEDDPLECAECRAKREAASNQNAVAPAVYVAPVTTSPSAGRATRNAEDPATALERINAVLKSTGLLERGPDGVVMLARHSRSRGARLREAEAELHRMRGALSECRGLLREFVDDEPCRPDHEGHCQTHGLSGGPLDTCRNRRARRLLGLDGDESG